MNEVDPSQLPLRDIHLPQPIGWWPLAPGWWVLAGVLLLLTLLALAGVWYYRRTRVARAARRELARIEQAYARDGDAHAFARSLSVLARRLALAAGGPDAVAATGQAWLAQLAALGQHELPPELAPVLLEAPYSRTRAEALDVSLYPRAAAVIRVWISASGRLRRGKPAHA